MNFRSLAFWPISNFFRNILSIFMRNKKTILTFLCQMKLLTKFLADFSIEKYLFIISVEKQAYNVLSCQILMLACKKAHGVLSYSVSLLSCKKWTCCKKTFGFSIFGHSLKHRHPILKILLNSVEHGSQHLPLCFAQL